MKVAMMLPPGFSAVFMVGMVVLVGGELTTVDDSNWWEACKGPVCTVAENQAEGLARLRVLSNYIKETMTLMETVIASLDNEMLEVGRELSNIVGRRCHARGHTALNALITHVNQTEPDNEILEVTSDNDDSWTSGSDITQESTSAWSSDVDLVSGSSSSHSTSQRPSCALHGTHQQTTSSTSRTWRGSSQYPSSTWQPTSQHHGSDSQISSTSSSSSSHSSSTTSHSNGKTLHRRPSSTLKKYEAVPTEQSEDVYVAPAPVETIDRQGGWEGGGRHEQGYGPGQGRGGGHGRGRGHGSSRGRGRGRSQGGLLSLALGTLQCLGVPVGSPHYVPGLDSWCESNCAAGNCPATHCVCS